jgi:hypothetical protein
MGLKNERISLKNIICWKFYCISETRKLKKIYQSWLHDFKAPKLLFHLLLNPSDFLMIFLKDGDSRVA